MTHLLGEVVRNADVLAEIDDLKAKTKLECFKNKNRPSAISKTDQLF
jgi:hypothetical protein